MWFCGHRAGSSGNGWSTGSVLQDLIRKRKLVGLGCGGGVSVMVFDERSSGRGGFSVVVEGREDAGLGWSLLG